MDFKYFNFSEFNCPCCGKNETKLGFIILLDKARHIAGFPFLITSGYRCEKHNKEVGGSSTSEHLEGIAADISCGNSQARFRLVTSLLDAGFKRIGIGETFIHAGYGSSEHPFPVMWLY